MKQKSTFIFIVILLAVALLAVSCSSGDTPSVETVEVTRIVTEMEEVEVTRIVEGEVVTEVQEVEVTRVVEVTAEEPAAEPVTITYFTFSAAPDHLEDLDQMIALFEDQNPGINVEVETAPFGEYFTKLQALIAGGEAPDVFELNYESFVTFAAKGVLADLTPLAEADADYADDVFYPRSLEAFNYNGRQLALPATFSTVVLFYNKDMFDAAGLDYPTNDWTWEDAVAAAAPMTDADAGVWGLHSGIQFWEFYKKAAQNGCEFFNADMTEVTIDSAACVETLQTMLNFIETDKVMPSDTDMAGLSDGDMFTSQQIAMDVTGIWMFSAFADAPFAWDIAVEPGMETQATHFFSNGVSVFAATEHRDAAWAWAKFFTSSPDMADIRIESGWELPTLNNPDYVDGYLAQTPPENREAVFESLNYAIVPPVIERQNEMQDAVNQLLDQVKLGELTPEEALAEAKVQIEELLK
jgi:multiple sugar transport system substrate-binding protein